MSFCIASSLAISTHSLTKRLTVSAHIGARTGDISTHSLTKRLTDIFARKPHNRCYFNSQPHEEADNDPAVGYSQDYNFNSQPHEEADGAYRDAYDLFDISTHSLTKRLTFDNLQDAFNDLISTHSLTKRLTHVHRVLSVHADISTHSLTKRLTISGQQITDSLLISTHSLTKRLTAILDKNTFI